MTMPPPPGRRRSLGELRQAPQIIPADQLPPPPAPPQPEVADGEETVELMAPFDPNRLVYPGEILHGGITLAVLLPGDDKESYFSGKHTAIAQPHEDYADVKGRVITTTRDLVVSEIEDIMMTLEEIDEQQRAAQAEAAAQALAATQQQTT